MIHTIKQLTILCIVTTITSAFIAGMNPGANSNQPKTFKLFGKTIVATQPKLEVQVDHSRKRSLDQAAQTDEPASKHQNTQNVMVDASTQSVLTSDDIFKAYGKFLTHGLIEGSLSNSSRQWANNGLNNIIHNLIKTLKGLNRQRSEAIAFIDGILDRIKYYNVPLTLQHLGFIKVEIRICQDNGKTLLLNYLNDKLIEIITERMNGQLVSTAQTQASSSSITSSAFPQQTLILMNPNNNNLLNFQQNAQNNHAYQNTLLQLQMQQLQYTPTVAPAQVTIISNSPSASPKLAHTLMNANNNNHLNLSQNELNTIDGDHRFKNLNNLQPYISKLNLITVWMNSFNFAEKLHILGSIDLRIQEHQSTMTEGLKIAIIREEIDKAQQKNLTAIKNKQNRRR